MPVQTHDSLPLNLATLDSKPSWHNLAGRVDRSACMELRASAAKRWADLKRCPTGRTASRRAIERGRPQAKTSREAAGPATISAYEIHAYLQRRKPRRLSGDYRTVKANAMRIARDPEGQPLPPRDKAQGPRNPKPGPDQHLHVNPNLGVCRTKLLGLPGASDWPDFGLGGISDFGLRISDLAGRGAVEAIGLANTLKQIRHPKSEIRNQTQSEISHPTASTAAQSAKSEINDGVWEQTFTIERWRQHERLAQHFILCPTCGDKYVKLFLPLCTKEELRDALLAQQWLHLQSAHPQLRRQMMQNKAGVAAFIRQLHERYSLLFQPRGFQCRKCLGVRYGTGGRHKEAF